jgi:hypothetical protein
VTRAFFAFALLIGSVATACGQAPPAPLLLEPLSAPRATPPVPPVSNGDALLDRTPILAEHAESTGDRFRFSADLGLPTGIRVGAQIGESRFWAEFGVGVWWIVPFASTALRYDCRVYDGSSDRIAVRPSVSATYIPIIRDVVFGAGADIECVWQHHFSDRFITDFGFRVGATALFGPWSHDSRVPVAPVIAVVFAAQF